MITLLCIFRQAKMKLVMFDIDATLTESNSLEDE